MVLDPSSTTWVLVSTAMVQLMTPGLGLFYGGLVSATSVLTMMMQVFISMGITSIAWFLVVFSLCFGSSGGFIGSPATYLGLRGVNVNEPLTRDGEVVGDGIPGLLFVCYQGMFAVITPALMTGAFANRFRFKPYLVFLVLWLVLVYAPWCHWIWGGGFLAEWGVMDFAGGLVVHTTAGFSALASLLVVGRRQNGDKNALDPPHNVPFVALGTALLWFGWFGFNGGSALASGPVAVAAAVNSEIAASVAMLAWIIVDWYRSGRPKLVGLCVGAIAGLATVTPAAGFVQPWGAFVLGIVAAVVCCGSCEAIKCFGLDDALDVWGVHGMGGFCGAILVGVLADPAECLADATGAPSATPVPSYCVNPGSVSRSWEQLGKQLVASCFCAAYSFAVTWAILQAINLVIPIIPPPHAVSCSNLDMHEHGEQAYAGHPKRGDAEAGVRASTAVAPPSVSASNNTGDEAGLGLTAA